MPFADTAGSTRTDVPVVFAGTPLVWECKDRLAPGECAELRERCAALMGDACTVQGVHQGRGRAELRDASLQRRLESLVMPSLPNRLEDFELVGLSSLMRFYQYTRGQEFRRHPDYWYQASPREITLLTIVVYLDEDFEGGLTRFDTRLAHALRQDRHGPMDTVFRPKTGHIGIWQHQVMHESTPITRGVKTVLRTDAVYRAPTDIGLVGGLERSRFHR